MKIIRTVNKINNFNIVATKITQNNISPNALLKFDLPKKKDFKEFPFYQSLLEQYIIFCEKRMQKTKYSKNPEVALIEKSFAQKGVTIRFKNNLAIANFIQKGLVDIEKAGYDIPKHIFIVSSRSISGAGGAALIFRERLKAKAPILFPESIKAMSKRKVEVKYKSGVYSTDNISQYIFHEVGHWLHFQNKQSRQICEQIWQTANKELIGKEVSQMALKLSDGTEFVAEVFAGLIDGRKYSNHVMEIYKKLNGPLKN